MNNYKDEHEDVLDPFALGPDWFAIDFSSYLVEPGPGLSQKKIAAVQATIQRLRLNADDSFVQQRCRVVGQYVRDEITLLHMDNTYPFIAEELRRQGLTEAIKGMYRTAK
ncbi:MAG TPA: hypothetical protein VJT81_00730 [Burkholderiales bacterium]|nr:hypothetical protein [Burkholderiales bacterium]